MGTANFLITCPTRGRPERFKGMVDSLYEHAKNPEKIYVAMHIDKNDACFEEYRQFAHRYTNLWPIYDNVCPRYNVSEKLNRIVRWGMEEAPFKPDLFITFSDSCRMIQPNWDERLTRWYNEEIPPSKIAIACFNHPAMNPKNVHMSPGILTREWYEQAGYHCYLQLIHFYTDEWADNIAKRIGRWVFLNEFHIGYLHHKLGNVKPDEQHNFVRRPEIIKHDQLVWRQTEAVRIQIANQIKEHLTSIGEASNLISNVANPYFNGDKNVRH